MLVQQHSEELARSLHYPVSDSTSISAESPNSSDRANKVLAFDGSGDPVVSTTTLAGFESGATDAAASAAAAATSETNAANSATNAATSASNAAAEVSNAQTEVTYAAEWANKAEDSLISAAAGGDQVDDYSAKHFASKASASATSAAASATAAAAALTRSWIIAASDEITALATGVGKATFRAPEALTLSEVRASVNTASTSGVVTVDINKNGTTMLSTKLTIDSGEKTSKTAATAAVISVTSIADDDEITIDIDTAGTGAKGLKVALIGDLP